MRKVFTFVPLIQLMRECKLATKAGFFYPLQDGFIPIKRRPVFTERFGNVSLAQATVLAAVTGRPLFFSTYANTVHNVHTQRFTVPTGTKLPFEETLSNPIKRPPYYTADTCALPTDSRIGINTNN